MFKNFENAQEDFPVLTEREFREHYPDHEGLGFAAGHNKQGDLLVEIHIISDYENLNTYNNSNIYPSIKSMNKIDRNHIVSVGRIEEPEIISFLDNI